MKTLHHAEYYANELTKNSQIFKSLTDIDIMFQDNQEFVSQAKKELFSERIYVYDTKGKPFELPVGSTVIDFAYKQGSIVGNTMTTAIVNEEYVSVDYVLQNQDRVKIITDNLAYGPKIEWEEKAQTTRAKSKIREFNP